MSEQRFSLFLPEGFIELPTGELDEEGFRALAAEIAQRFGMDPEAEIDQGLAETTVMLATTAAAAEAGGSCYTAAGFFRSPEVEARPIMALVSCFPMESEHESTEVAIAGLDEVHRNTANGEVRIVELPAGPAVVAENTSANQAKIDDHDVELTEHSVTAWVPGPGVVMGVAVTSNNTEDWAHVKDMAEGLFETFEWETEPVPA
ncbi:hypothetical protein [Amycolatopsis sp. CA-230715]|uniref:hypothetical protein n=1 Tax=Amycolatopsis sp. CA-230715 TaxID=2745196 RepID=UPI001C028020|nr:hypothetical protein [Amycolatopsis sp. CA-230715]QWF80381.1 hypothetical protein HUW46_03801 [Amycolatopsis sp. CA-230715]